MIGFWYDRIWLWSTIILGFGGLEYWELGFSTAFGLEFWEAAGKNVDEKKKNLST